MLLDYLVPESMVAKECLSILAGSEVVSHDVSILGFCQGPRS